MGGFRRLFTVVVLATTLLFTTQCGGSKSSGVSIQDADPGECTHSPFDGDSTPKVHGSQFQLVDIGLFGKPMVEDHLLAVMNISGKATWNYVLGLGIDLYKVTQFPESPCKYHSSLKEAQGKHLSAWQNNNKKASGRLAGLFRAQYDYRKMYNPTIMVRTDTQRWVLVHELAHYLFLDGLIKSGDVILPLPTASDIDRINRELERLHREFDKHPTNEKAIHLIRQWKKVFDINYYTDKQGLLEEFAIESYLIAQSRKGLFGLIDTGKDLSNGLWYMKGSYSPLSDFYNEEIRQLQRLRPKLNGDWFVAVSEFNRLFKSHLDLVEFMDEKLAEAKANTKFLNRFADRHQFVDRPSPALHYDREIFDLRKRLQAQRTQ